MGPGLSPSEEDCTEVCKLLLVLSVKGSWVQVLLTESSPNPQLAPDLESNDMPLLGVQRLSTNPGSLTSKPTPLEGMWVPSSFQSTF